MQTLIESPLCTKHYILTGDRAIIKKGYLCLCLVDNELLDLN